LVGAEVPAGGEARATVTMTDAGEVAAPLLDFGLAVSRLDTDALVVPVAELAARVGAIARAGADAIVCDAATDAHLAAIATAVRSAGIAVLWVGSAGLMRPLAAAVGPTERPALPKPVAAAGPLLMVVGSATAVSCAQFEALVADPDVVGLRVDAAELQAAAGAQHGIAAELDAAIGRGRDTALIIAPGSTPPSRLDQGLAAVLADIVAPRLARCAGLVVTGGETARHLLARAGLAGIRIAGEVEVGVPWGWGLGRLGSGAIQPPEGAGGSGGRGLAIVTKAGAFGDVRTLVRCRRALRATGT